jgi:hypothetical protein
MGGHDESVEGGSKQYTTVGAERGLSFINGMLKIFDVPVTYFKGTSSFHTQNIFVYCQLRELKKI